MIAFTLSAFSNRRREVAAWVHRFLQDRLVLHLQCVAAISCVSCNVSSQPPPSGSRYECVASVVEDGFRATLPVARHAGNRVSEVATSCGCITVQGLAVGSVIDANSQVEVSIKSDNRLPSKHLRHVLLRFESGEAITYSIDCTNNQGLPSASPPYVMLNSAARSATVRVDMNNSGAQILGIDAPEVLRLSRKPVDEGSDVTSLSVEVDASMITAQEYEGDIVINTSCGAMPTIRIPFLVAGDEAGS